MDELFQSLNAASIPYLLIGGQAMRLIGTPRFSMDWDFLIPPRDEQNFQRLNQLPGPELDVPLEMLGPRGENFVQTYQTHWGIWQFDLGIPGVPALTKPRNLSACAQPNTASELSVFRACSYWRRNRRSADRRTRRTLNFYSNSSAWEN